MADTTTATQHHDDSDNTTEQDVMQHDSDANETVEPDTGDDGNDGGEPDMSAAKSRDESAEAAESDDDEKAAVQQAASEAEEPEDPFTRADLPLFTRFWLWLLGGMFDRVKFFKKNVKLINRYHAKGALIHVFQYRSYLEYLLLNHFLLKSDLPPVVYPYEGWISALWRRSFGRLAGKGARLSARRRPDEHVKVGSHYLIFLQSRGSFLSVRSQSRIDEIQELLEIQKQTETALYLVPHIPIWNRYPVNAIKSPVDMLFGNSLNPGRLRRIIIFLRNYGNAFIRTGEPLRLSDWTSDEFARHGKSAIKEMRWRLFTFFSEERMAVTGPMTRPRTWILESVLNSQEVQEVIAQVAREEERSREDVTAEAARDLDKIAADYKFTFILFANMVLSRTLWKLYSPLIIDEEGIERVRELVKKQAVVYVPSHKSHADYLTWSYILNTKGIYPPHIVAGENMAFWPMGYLFRRMGAFFIRRSFKGNRLYATILRGYMTRMLYEGYSQEFFIEGTRSRTGKLLMPKFGILSIYVDAYLRNPDRDIIFVPVSIIYNKLIEEQSHGKELAGGKKSKESTGSLIRLLELLRFRFGALYLRVGEPFSLGDYAREHELDPRAIEGKTRRRMIQEVGYDIIYRINQVATATPSAVVSTALLAGGRKGVTQKKLIGDVELAIDYLKAHDVQLSESLGDSLFAVTEALEAFKKDGSIQSHTIGNEIIYTINDNKRLSLDYYKNYVLHFFAPASFLAIAFSSLSRERAPLSEVRRRALYLADLFRYEIVYPPRGKVDKQIDDALKWLRTQAVFDVNGEDELVALESADDKLMFFRNQLYNFLESYWIVAASLSKLLEKRMPEKKFIGLLMDEGKKLTLIGEVERGEAYSKVNFINAIQYFVHRGIVVRDEEFEDTSVAILPEDARQRRKMQKKLSKKATVYLELADDYASEEVVQDLADELRAYLRR